MHFSAKGLIPSGPLSRGKNLEGMLLKEDINAPLKESSGAQITGEIQYKIVNEIFILSTDAEFMYLREKP